MAEKKILPLSIQLGAPPLSQADLMRWAGAAQRAITDLYRLLADRTEQMIAEGTTTGRPTTKGTKRLYFDTDKKILYYDVGTWEEMRVETIATASLPAAGAAQNGRLIIEDVGAGDRNLILYAGGQRFRVDGGVAF